jgi:hypothetical protein
MSGATCPIFIFTAFAFKAPGGVCSTVGQKPEQSLYRFAHSPRGVLGAKELSWTKVSTSDCANGAIIPISLVIAR